MTLQHGVAAKLLHLPPSLSNSELCVVVLPLRVLLPLSQQVLEPHIQALRELQSQPPS